MHCSRCNKELPVDTTAAKPICRRCLADVRVAEQRARYKAQRTLWCSKCGQPSPYTNGKTYPQLCRRCRQKQRFSAKHEFVGAEMAPTERVCPKCFNLPHRVKGSTCIACGLAYEEEPIFLMPSARKPLNIGQEVG